MLIIQREKTHEEVTAPEVWTTHCAGRMTDVTIELPSIMVELTPDEARQLLSDLTAALTKEGGK